MTTRFLTAFWLFVAAACMAAPAYAQGASTASLSGTVVDSSGGVIPGADILAKNSATGVEFHAVSDDKGFFLLPSLPPGTYAVTTSLQGFKKSVIPNVVLNVSTQSTVKATLEVGGLEEVVTVTAGAAIVQTQSSVIATTIDANQISNLPLVSRDAINAVTMLPGVDTASTNRNSTVSGLPRAAVSITLDGVNTQDNNNKSTEGLFSLISPRLDAIQEVTVSTATAGADATGQGAVQIKFVTRQGTNRFQGSAYAYFRDPRWNSNYWFNNRDLPPDPATGKAPVDQVKITQPGFRLGGPIVRNRSFFFFNYEESRQPNEITRQRTILGPLATQGIFQYNITGGVRQVNVLQLAAANGQLATLDPTVSKLLADIRASTSVSGGLTQLSDPNEQRFTFIASSLGFRRFPTVRIDHNLTDRHRVTGTFVRQNFDSNPDTLNNSDPSFPGFPIQGSQSSNRTTWSAAVRSSLSGNLVNEVHGGYTNSFVFFSPQITADAFKNASVGNMNGFNFTLSGSSGSFGNTLTNAAPGRNTQGRENPTVTIEDNLTWLHGSHTVAVGGAMTHIGLHSYDQNVVPQVTFGIATGDPALAMFNATNFQGASTTNITAAQQLYSILTGRVTTITANAQLDEETNKYSYLGSLANRGQQREYGFYVQDSWRVRQNVTLNYGLRYELQGAFIAKNDTYSLATIDDLFGVSGAGNLFKPGTLTGRRTQYELYSQDTPLFNTDWTNFAPSVGVTWRPHARDGFLGRLIGGDDKTVVRAAYAKAYNRQGIGDFDTNLGGNPGGTINADRSQTNGNLGPVPLLFRNTSQLGAPAFPATPVYPLTGATSNSVNVYDQNIRTPFTHSMTIGVQRELSRNTAIEVRYVGTRNRAGWVVQNYNEAIIKENGFVDEFRKAQANLQANVAAGRGSSFAYFGPNTGTQPLPIYLAFFSAVPAAQAGDASKYNSTSWTSTNFTNALAVFNPLPYVPAGTSATTSLPGDPTRQANSILAGLPANFFRANPNQLGGANFVTDDRFGSYDSLQIELHRRLSSGLQIAGNYVLANAYDSTRYSLREPRQPGLSVGNNGGIHHALKLNWVYELPFGEGKKWANSSGLLDRLAGGWGFDGNARIQSGEILSFGNVRPVGMSADDLANIFQVRKDDVGHVVYLLPQDVIDNTIKAFSTSATSPTGYGSLGAPSGRYLAPANSPSCLQIVIGDCAPRELYVTGPRFVRFDLSAVKRVALVRGTSFEFRVDVLNAFNNIDFIPTTAVPTSSTVANGTSIANVQTSNTGFASATLGQVTSAYRDANNTADPGGRLVQLAIRVNW
jgi:hypothetical protein